MKLTRLNKVMIGVLAGTALPVLAASITANAGFRTIQDVSISETQSINFGNEVIPLAGNSCTLAGVGVQGGTTTSASVGTAVTVSSATVSAGAGTLTGTGCGSTAGTAGYFTLSGQASTVVRVTVSSTDPAVFPDYTFTPNSGNFIATTTIGAAQSILGGNSPTVTSYFPDTQFNATLDSTGGGTLFVGGRLVINNDIAYDTSYSATYDVDVTY
jgi:hypothetical protein